MTKTSVNRYNSLVISFAALGSLTYGYAFSCFGGTIGLAGWYNYFHLPLATEPGYSAKTTPAIATANGLLSAGGALSCLVMMWSADAIGRKPCIQVGALFCVLGGILQGGAVNLGMFQAGRFFSGCGIGFMVTVCPMYMSELAPPAHRGWLVGHHAIFVVLGYTLSGWLGYACYYASSTAALLEFAWRFQLIFQVVPPLVLLCGSFWLPRSPRWLVSKGRLDEAWEVIRRIRNSPADPEDLQACEEFYQIREQLALESANRGQQSLWKLVVTKKSYRKRMIIGFLTQWGAEFGGPLVVTK